MVKIIHALVFVFLLIRIPAPGFTQCFQATSKEDLNAFREKMVRIYDEGQKAFESKDYLKAGAKFYDYGYCADALEAATKQLGIPGIEETLWIAEVNARFFEAASYFYLFLQDPSHGDYDFKGYPTPAQRFLEWARVAFGTALDVIKKHGLENNPKVKGIYAKAYSRRGEVFFVMGYVIDALEDLNKSIQLNPQDPISYADRGCAYYFKGLQGEARKDFEKAASLGHELSKKYIAGGQKEPSCLYHADVKSTSFFYVSSDKTPLKTSVESDLDKKTVKKIEGLEEADCKSDLFLESAIPLGMDGYVEMADGGMATFSLHKNNNYKYPGEIAAPPGSSNLLTVYFMSGTNPKTATEGKYKAFYCKP